MAQLMMVNPRRRKRRTTKKKVTRARRPRRRVTTAKSRSPARRYRRNPIARRGGAGIMNQQVIPAAVAASGALGLDVIWGWLPIPMNIKTGAFRHVAKGAGAIAMGMVASQFMNRKTAMDLSTGALTVVIHGAMREMAQGMMPNVPLGYYSAGMPVGEYVNGMGEYTDGNMGAYITGAATSPYLAADTLSKPFAGPSAREIAQTELDTCLEKEGRNTTY